MNNLLEILETQREGFIKELGNAPTPEIREAFRAEVEAVDAKIQAEKARQEEEQQKVEEVAQTVSDALDTIEIGGLTFNIRQLTKGEDEAQIVRAALINIGTANAQKFLREISTVKADMEAKLAAKDTVINTLNAEVDSLKEDNAGLADSFDEMAQTIKEREEKLAEQEKEISRLNSHVDDLRGQIAMGNARPIIDITTQAGLAEVAQRLKEKQEKDEKKAQEEKEAAKPRVYNVRPGDLKTSFYIANLATTGEEIEIRPWTELKSKYVVLESEAEVSRFREAEAVKVSEATENNLSLVVDTPKVESPRFQNDIGLASDGEGLQSGAGFVGGYVTQEAFDALTRRVEALEAVRV